MARIGYLRPSLAAKNEYRQIGTVLLQGSCDRLVFDATSFASRERPALLRLLRELRTGDTLVVYSLERLAHSFRALRWILSRLAWRGVNLVLMRQGIDTSLQRTRRVQLELSCLRAYRKALAEEQALLERRRGKLTAEDLTRIRDLLRDPHMRKKHIAEKFDVCVKTLNRYLNARRYRNDARCWPRRSKAQRRSRG
jgi:DNA invertase Pin-like site-specific DNA recombinase